MGATLTPTVRFLLRFSTTPEAWLDRRLALTRSFAMAAIAGWLLGLGERAPHRILLDTTTGEAMHVGTQAILNQRVAPRLDAVDETTGAPHADAAAAPEPPFRLTREMVDAMGPGGVDGPFRNAAEVALRFLCGR